MGSKRTARDKAWARDGKIGLSYEPPVEGYSKGVFGGSEKKTTQRWCGAVDDRVLKMNDEKVYQAYLRILAEAHSRTPAHFEEETLLEIMHVVGIKQKSLRKRIDEMSKGGLITQIKDRLILSESGKEFLSNPEEWKRKWREKAGSTEQAFDQVLRQHLNREAERELDEELGLMKKELSRVQVLNQREVEDLTHKVSQLSVETADLSKKQPKCWQVPDYDHRFQAFSAQIEVLSNQNDYLRNRMHSCLLAKEYVDKAKTQADTLKELLAETKSEQNSQMRQWKIQNLLAPRQSLIQDLESFIEHAPDTFWKLPTTYDEITAILSRLRKPTHQWQVIKQVTVAVKPTRPQREDESRDKPQPQVRLTYATGWKCGKCGKVSEKLSP